MIFLFSLSFLCIKRRVGDLNNIIMEGDFRCKTNNPQDQTSNKLQKIVSVQEM